MTDEKLLESAYKESLEENIVSHLAEIKGISLEDAMDIYYRSKLSKKIFEGRYGIQYLDYKNLVRIICETEPELF